MNKSHKYVWVPYHAVEMFDEYRVSTPHTDEDRNTDVLTGKWNRIESLDQLQHVPRIAKANFWSLTVRRSVSEPDPRDGIFVLLQAQRDSLLEQLHRQFEYQREMIAAIHEIAEGKHIFGFKQRQIAKRVIQFFKGNK